LIQAHVSFGFHQEIALQKFAHLIILMKKVILINLNLNKVCKFNIYRVKCKET